MWITTLWMLASVFLKKILDRLFICGTLDIGGDERKGILSMFKPGDIVVHKTTRYLKMVVSEIDESKTPRVIVCTYYSRAGGCFSNDDFFDHELQLVEEKIVGYTVSR
jgi:hypothetical protein